MTTNGTIETAPRSTRRQTVMSPDGTSIAYDQCGAGLALVEFFNV